VGLSIYIELFIYSPCIIRLLDPLEFSSMPSH